MTKRIREAEITTMANYLMLLSSATAGGSGGGEEFTRVFTCKTCDRQFSSFQALGGHRASHKKPRVAAAAVDGGEHRQPPPMSPPKPKTHECPVCGLEFPIGQALGGHMRRHRVSAGGFDGNRKMDMNNNNNSDNRRRILCMDLNLTPLENKFAAVDCFF